MVGGRVQVAEYDTSLNAKKFSLKDEVLPNSENTVRVEQVFHLCSLNYYACFHYQILGEIQTEWNKNYKLVCHF